MFVRLVYESFRRQKRRKLLAGAAITLGVTVATAMIGVATDIGDKINRELRTIGANLVITPQEDSLDLEIGGVNLKPPTHISAKPSCQKSKGFSGTTISSASRLCCR
jgi:putative ABC transport system permease protein